MPKKPVRTGFIVCISSFFLSDKLLTFYIKNLKNSTKNAKKSLNSAQFAHFYTLLTLGRANDHLRGNLAIKTLSRMPTERPLG